MAITFSMAGGAIAAGSVAPSVTATGTVERVCSSAVNGSIAFTIDPSGSGNLTPSAADATKPTVKCTKGESVGVTCTQAHANLTPSGDGTGDAIAYSITTCADGVSAGNITGGGFTTATKIPIGITIADGAYQNATAGVHQDTITVTVSY